MHKVRTSHFLIVHSISKTIYKKNRLWASRLNILEHKFCEQTVKKITKRTYISKYPNMMMLHDNYFHEPCKTTKQSINCRLQLILVNQFFFVLIEHDCYSQHRHLFPYMVYPNDPKYQVWKDIPLIKSNAQYTTELTSSMSKYQENNRK